MNLEEAINLLEDTFSTIDIRTAAYFKNNCWNSAILVIRFRKESVDVVQKQQEQILKTHGRINTKEFQICFSALSITKWEEMRTDWKKNFVKFNDQMSVNINSSIAFTHTFNEPYTHRGYCNIDEGWNSYYTSSQDSGGNVSEILYNHQAEARKLYSRDIHEYLSKIFEMTEANTNSPPRYIVIVPIFLKINQVEFDDKSFNVDCEGFPMGEIVFKMNFYERHGSYKIPKQSMKTLYNFQGDAPKKTKFRISEKLSNIPLSYEFKLDVYRKNGVLIDSEYGTVGKYWPTKNKITNPKFLVFGSFVNFDQLKDMVINLKAKELKAPDKVFERGINWLLNLMGFSAIRLEEYERAGQDPEQISMDIIASFGEKQIILANATLSMPDTAMLETERNRRIILSRSLNNEVKVTSVIFTPKSIIQLQQEAERHEVAIIGKDEIERILNFLKNGEIKEARDMILNTIDFRNSPTL